MAGSDGDMTVSPFTIFLTQIFNLASGLGSVVVFISTVTSIWSGTSNALVAVVIVQAGSFVSACRSIVR